MSLQASADFFTDPRMFLVPIAVLVLFMAAGIPKGFAFTFTAWQRLLHVQAFLAPLAVGLVFGPAMLGRILAGGGELSLEWEAVINGTWLALWLLALFYAIGKLRDHPDWGWLRTGIIAYNIGVLLNILLQKGTPFMEAIGAT